MYTFVFHVDETVEVVGFTLKYLLMDASIA